MTLFPVFLITMIIHGFGFWFHYVFPIAIVFISPGLILVLAQLLLRQFTSCIYNFEIIDISVSGKCNYIMLYLIKPKNYKLVHGQYVYLNIPEIHLCQWHPFTVASSPNSPYLILMIKRVGDWTNKLVKTLHKCK